LGGEPRLAERVDVHSLNAIGLRLYRAHVGPATIASRDIIRELMQDAASAVGGHKFGQHFLLTEWEQVMDAWLDRTEPVGAVGNNLVDLQTAKKERQA
jgi:hypothetical protein